MERDKTAELLEGPPIPHRLTTEMIKASVRDLRPTGHTATVGFGDYGLAMIVGLDFQAQPFGGRRCFFRCPRCEQRCILLYGLRYLGATGWKCRKCWGLVYPSQRQRPSRRQWSRALRLSDELLDPNSPEILSRPRGMHRETFGKKCAESGILRRVR